MQSRPFLRAANRWLLILLALMVTTLSAWRDTRDTGKPPVEVVSPMPIPASCEQVAQAVGGLLQGMTLNNDVAPDRPDHAWPELACTWRDPVLMNKGLTVVVSRPAEDEVEWAERLLHSTQLDDPRLLTREVTAYTATAPVAPDNPLGDKLTVGTRYFRVSISGIAMLGLATGYPTLTLDSAMEAALRVYDTAASVPGIVLLPTM